MVRRGRYNFSKSVHNLNGGKQNKNKKGRLLKTDSVIIVFLGENFISLHGLKL